MEFPKISYILGLIAEIFGIFIIILNINIIGGLALSIIGEIDLVILFYKTENKESRFFYYLDLIVTGTILLFLLFFLFDHFIFESLYILPEFIHNLYIGFNLNLFIWELIIIGFLSYFLVKFTMIAAYKSNDHIYFLDATGGYLPLGLPSTFIQGKEALVSYGEDQYEVFQVEEISADTNMFIDTIAMNLNPDLLIYFFSKCHTPIVYFISSRSHKNRPSYKNAHRF